MCLKKIDSFLNCIINGSMGKCYSNACENVKKYGTPLLLFYIRFWIAKIFFYSGLTKISNFNTTIYLFQYEYKVPVISPIFAAYSATAIELICPVMLLLGLMTRLNSIPMAAMIIIIELTYLQLPEHKCWLIVLGVLITQGAGKISIDYLLVNRYRNLK